MQGSVFILCVLSSLRNPGIWTPCWPWSRRWRRERAASINVGILCRTPRLQVPNISDFCFPMPYLFHGVWDQKPLILGAWTLGDCQGSPTSSGWQDNRAVPIGVQVPRAPNVPLLRALWSLLVVIWDLWKGSRGVLVRNTYTGIHPKPELRFLNPKP